MLDLHSQLNSKFPEGLRLIDRSFICHSAKSAMLTVASNRYWFVKYPMLNAQMGKSNFWQNDELGDEAF